MEDQSLKFRKMNPTDKYHDQAMETAFQADQERRLGNIEKASELYRYALDLELKAIKEMHEPVEPTYSILHRSAGWLAIDCNEIRLAEKLASKALSGDPHPRIAEELRDLLEQVGFQRHLELKGVTLEVSDIQISVSGHGVGLGIVRHDDVIQRIDNSTKAIRRIVERKCKKPFRERGRSEKHIEENYQLFLSTPRAASFAVTLKLGSRPDQLLIKGLTETNAVLDEFMDLMEMVNQSQLSDIQDRISDLAYFRNFLGLSKKIAPDGERIRQVGFTAVKNGAERYVEVTNPARKIPSISAFEGSLEIESESFEIFGILKYADAIKGNKNEIKLIDDDNKTHVIEVPVGMMNDIVGPMWDTRVKIMGTRSRNRSVLDEIWPEESE